MVCRPNPFRDKRESRTSGRRTTRYVWWSNFRASSCCFLVSVGVLTLAVQHQSVDPLIWPVFFPQNCSFLGFPDAVLNSCGYCVGGSTNLPLDYGKDCHEQCGNARLDCNGTCGGQAYIDECSGKCTLPGQDDPNNRDCLGLCLTGENAVRVYHKDDCGFCGNFIEGSPSRFKDCKNTCVLPGNMKTADFRWFCGACQNYSSLTNNETCPHIECVNGTEVCVECKSNKRDICGNCDKKGTKCLKINHIFPTHIPSDTSCDITLKGSFEDQKRNLTCLFYSLTDPNFTNYTVTSITNLKTNLTIKCKVRLPIGRYQLAVKENKTASDTQKPDTVFLDNEFLEVYDKNMAYKSMTPTSVHYRSILNVTNHDNDVELHFEGKNVLEANLTCKILANRWPRWLSKRINPHKDAKPHVCILPLIWSSQVIVVKPTFDGQNSLGVFNFTYFAAAPKIESATISSDGIVISVSFDRTINICGLYKCPCSDLLEESTLTELGPGVTCKWATKAQLLIIPKQALRVNSVRVQFKPNILKEDGQEIAYAATENLEIVATRQHSEAVQMVISISGPNRIPSCGIFTIFGHHSAPSDGQPDYFWSVTRMDEQEVSQQLQDAVKNKNDPDTGLNLDLESQWFETGIVYTFELEVVSKGGNRYSKSHQIERMPYYGPLIVAYSSASMNLQPLRPSQCLTLFYEMTIPKCLGFGQRALAYWTSSDPRVKMSLNGDLFTNILTIKPYSLPENSVITFTANALLVQNSSLMTSSSVQVTVGPRRFMAKIRGTGNRTIGSQMHVNASHIVMKGEAYGDTDGLPLRYEWRCFAIHRDLTDKEQEREDSKKYPCYNYGPTNDSRLYLVNETEQAQKDIVFSARQIDTSIVSRLLFTLKVFNASNPDIFEKDDTILLISEEKWYPQVVIEELKVRNVPIHEKNPDGVYLVPAGASIVVEANIVPVPRYKFKKILWNVTGITENYFIATTLEKTHLLIPEGVTAGYGDYTVTLNVCNGIGTICNTDRIDLYAVPGVSNCRVTIENYQAFSMVNAEIAACHVPFGRSPLTYQLFFTDYNDELVALTGPQFANVFRFVGPPSPLSVSREIESNFNETINGTTTTTTTMVEVEELIFANESYPITLTIEVCDGLFICTLLEPERVIVNSSANTTVATLNLLAEAQNLAYSGNPIGALSLLSVPARYGHLHLVSDAILKFIKEAISVVPLMPGQVSLIYDCLEPFLQIKDVPKLILVLGSISKATTKAFKLSMTPPFPALNRAYSFTSMVAANNPYNVDLLRHVSKTQDLLIQTLVGSAPLAQRLEFRSRTDPTSSVLYLYHMYLNNELFYLRSNATSTGPPDVTLRFSPKVRERITSRSCGYSDCQEVSIVLILYPGHSLHPEGNVGERVSPVISVKIFSPQSGNEIPIYEDGGLELHFLDGSKPKSDKKNETGMIVRCHKWDGETWSMEFVQTLGSSENRVHCVASTSGLFTALKVKSGISGGTIAGIVVAALMFVTIMGMVVMFFIRLKNSKEMRVGSSY